MRFVIIGGSASATPELADALAAWPGGVGRRPALDIVLVGRSAQRLELVAGEMRRRLTGLDGPVVSVSAETELDAALDGADVVLHAVRVGGLDARVFDETFPQAHGVPGEETLGPGGFANALRTVPAVLPQWERIAELAPDALLINLTNPSGIVVNAITRTLGLEVFSVCDSPLAFCDSIARRLGQPVSAVRARYQGMNHIGFWMPQDETQLEATLDVATGQDPDAVRCLGAVGAPYVRYYTQPGPILEKQQAADEVRAQQLQRLQAQLLKGYSAGSADLPRRGAVWYELAVLPVIDAWFAGSDDVLIVGLRNEGRIAGLADDVITEVPVRISQPKLVEAVPLEPLPDLAASLLDRHALFESLATTAALPGASARDRVRALMANPMVGSFDLASSLLADIEAGSPA